MSDEGKLYYRVYWVVDSRVSEGYGYRQRDFRWANYDKREEGLDFVPGFYIVENPSSNLIAISDRSYQEEIERHVVSCAFRKTQENKLRLADEKKSKEMLEIVEKYLADKKG